MREFWAVFRREVAQRRILFAGAVFAAALSLLAPLAAPGWEAADVRAAMASALACLMVTGIAVVLGFTMFGPEPSRGALGFLFARPIAGGTTWLGKVAAAITLLVGAYVITLIPAIPRLIPSLRRGGFLYVTDYGEGLGNRLTTEDLPGTVALVGILLAPALFLLSSALAVILRHRSWARVLHAVFAFGFGAAVAMSVGVLERVPTRSVLSRAALLFMLGAVLLTALAWASLQTVKSGRTDSRRAHRVFSWTLWPVLGLCGVFALAWTARVTTPRLHDLQSMRTVPSPRGPWIGVDGLTRWTRATFLLNVESGSWQRLGSWAARILFAADGSRAIWLVADDSLPSTAWTLMTANLRAPEPEPESTRISTSLPLLIAISPAGRRAAILTRSGEGGYILSVFDIPSSRQLSASRVKPCDLLWMGFRTDGEVRILLRKEKESTVLDFGVAGGLLAEQTIPAQAFLVVAGDEPGSRFVIREVNGVALLDFDRNRRVPLLSWPGRYLRVDARFLTDGEMAINHPHGSVSLFEPDGRLRRVVAIPGVEQRVVLGGEPNPGLLHVAAFVPEAKGQRWKLVAIAAKQDRDTQADLDLVPASESTLGSIGNELFYDGSSGWSLIHRDPETGRRRILIKTDLPEGYVWLLRSGY